jgi:hypothetical protein
MKGRSGVEGMNEIRKNAQLRKLGLRMRLFIVMICGLALVVPMVIMALHLTLEKSLITANVFVFAISFIVN